MRCFGLVLVAAILASAQARRPGLIVYTHAPQADRPWPVQDIWTVHADGADRRALTNDGHSHHPSWSPGGKRILFIHDAALSAPPPYRKAADTQSHHATELSVMDADGRNRRVLRVIEPVIYSAAWSPDGATLAISAATGAAPGQTPQAGLFLLPSSGTGKLRLLVPAAWTPSWSPDGQRLAFTVEHPRGRWTIHTADKDGRNDIRLTDPGVISGSPAWSPDGQRIAFAQTATAGGREQVFLMNADGSQVRQVTSDPAWSCGQPAWSPDGRALAVGCRSAASPCGLGVSSTGQPLPPCTRRLFVVPVERGLPGKPTRLTDHDGTAPSFAPR